MKKVLTLCLVHDERRILLGMKKRGFGAGRWNGFGGKVEPGEAIEAAARRELREEAGIEAGPLRPRGALTFEFEGEPEVLEVHLFSASAYDGEPVETEEMRPAWYALADIPYGLMWADDRHWLPLVLAGKDVRGRFLFRGQEEIVRHEIEELQAA